MLTQISHQQMANQLRQMIDQQPNQDHERAILLLRAFERCGWDEGLFMQIVDKVAPNQFTWGNPVQLHPAPDMYGHSQPTAIIADILEHYNQAVAPTCGDYPAP